MHLLINRKLAASIVLVIALAATYPASLNATTVTGTPAPEEVLAPIADLKLPPKAPEADNGALIVEEPPAMDIWLAKLAYQESKGKNRIKVMDVNGMYSYGCLQFQEGTFRTYALKYRLMSPSTPTESKIYDCDLQKKIAKLMLAEDYSNWRAWYTSVTMKSVGLPPR